MKTNSAENTEDALICLFKWSFCLKSNSLSGRRGTKTFGSSVQPTESQGGKKHTHTLQQLCLYAEPSFFFVYQFPGRCEELEHKDAAWFSSQTSRYRRSLCLLDTFMIHRGLRGESRRRNILSVLCSAAAAGKKNKNKLCCTICISFPSDGLPTERYILKNHRARRGNWNASVDTAGTTLCPGM